MSQETAQKTRTRPAEDDVDAPAAVSLQDAALEAATEAVVSEIDEALSDQEPQAKAEWAEAYSPEAQDAWHQKYGAFFKIIPSGICNTTIVVRR